MNTSGPLGCGGGPIRQPRSSAARMREGDRCGCRRHRGCRRQRRPPCHVVLAAALHPSPHDPIPSHACEPRLAKSRMPQQGEAHGEIVEIVRLGHAGDGVTGDGVFVPGTVPGDVARIRREGERGRLLELIAPGPTRTVPPCAHFGRCGGCALQHVAQPAYLAWKRDLVVTALKQRGFADVPVEEIHAVAPGTRRRASFKAQVVGGAVSVGFYEAGSRVLVDLSECPILVPELARIDSAPARSSGETTARERDRRAARDRDELRNRPHAVSEAKARCRCPDGAFRHGVRPRARAADMERRGRGDRGGAHFARGPLHREAAAGRVSPADERGRAGAAAACRGASGRRASCRGSVRRMRHARARRCREPDGPRGRQSRVARRRAHGGGEVGQGARERRDPRPLSPTVAGHRARALRCRRARPAAPRRRRPGQGAGPVPRAEGAVCVLQRLELRAGCANSRRGRLSP